MLSSCKRKNAVRSSVKRITAEGGWAERSAHAGVLSAVASFGVASFGRFIRREIMPVVLWLLGVPLTLIVVLMLAGVVHF